MSRRHFNTNIISQNTQESALFSKYITTLQSKIQGSSLSPSDKPFFPDTEEKSRSKASYKKDLFQQIEEKLRRKSKARQEDLKPGINEDFYGYPNIPQTPKDIRRKREISQMQEFRKGLDDQLSAKQQSFKTSKITEIESDKANNQIDYQTYLDHQSLNILKKKAERETLVESWDQAKKAKKLQDLIEKSERKGVNIEEIAKKSVDLNGKKEESFSKSQKKEEKTEGKKEEEKKGETGENSKQKLGFQVKAQKIKEYLDSKERSSYQYKIKEIIKEAKKNRGKYIGRNSASPGLYKGMSSGKALKSINKLL